MNIQIQSGDIHLINLHTRMPFKYGIATMTLTPHAFVRLKVAVNGKIETGIAADHLPPKWFTKAPDKPLADEVLEMARVIEHTVQAAEGKQGASAFAVWRQLWDAQEAWGRQQKLPPLLTHFGTSLVERAMLEAVCRAAGQPIGEMIRKNRLGIFLGDIHPELKDTQPADFLPDQPLSHLTARHTIGMADPLVDSDIPSGDRLDDSLPQSLEDCIAAYGLRHFKIKVFGQVERDLERLHHVAEVIQTNCHDDYAFSLDGNEQFRAADDFINYWNEISIHADLRDFFGHLLFVEQPFHRDIALSEDVLKPIVDWRDRPAMIIDESDGELNSTSHALTLGYAGTSHKNCKGIFKGIANACLLAHRQRQQPQQRLILSGEDLANIGPVALLQDLAMCAALGIASVERNGHHYFAGLSMFPQEVQMRMLDAHGDLYQPSRNGWPALQIRDGQLQLDSVNRAPFGVGLRLGVEQFPTIDEWRAGVGATYG